MIVWAQYNQSNLQKFVVEMYFIIDSKYDGKNP
jgi:hypothetical protein